MIYDEISNAKLYSETCRRLSEAVAFVRKVDRHTKDGRYDIDGDRMYASIASYTTKPDRTLPFEAHKRYIDVQFLLKGEERIDVIHGKGFRVKERYSKEKDILFVYPPETYSPILLKPGRFVVLYPHDFHRPGQSINKAIAVRKLVVKIRV